MSRDPQDYSLKGAYTEMRFDVYNKIHDGVWVGPDANSRVDAAINKMSNTEFIAALIEAQNDIT